MYFNSYYCNYFSVSNIPGDKLILGSLRVRYKTNICFSYNTKILGGLLEGCVIKEVMPGLLFMSLLVFIVSKLFIKEKKKISTKIYVIANIISAIQFATGHIPSTMAMTTLTPILLLRYFLLNSALGLYFGYLYKKCGIGYAILAHGFAHLISNILMNILIFNTDY